MTPLPRLFAMALFVVLAALTALTALPLLRRPAPVPATPPSAPLTAPATALPANPPHRAAAHVPQTAAAALAVLALGLATSLLFMPTARTGPRADLTTARQEIDALSRLAERSEAQVVELSRERDVRRRAEEDAQLRQNLLAQAVDEKIRLGRDLHDGIIQSLYAVGLTLETIRPLLQSDAATAERRLEEVRTTLNAAIRDVRTYITGLTPDNLRRAGFRDGVVALFEQLRAGRNATLELNVDDVAATHLSPEQNLEALQIAREAMSNALRHGHATRVSVRLHRGDGELALLIQDNGTGFDAPRGGGEGHGLANMRARASRLGADLRVSSQPGQGVRVIVTLPDRENPS